MTLPFGAAPGKEDTVARELVKQVKDRTQDINYPLASLHNGIGQYTLGDMSLFDLEQVRKWLTINLADVEAILAAHQPEHQHLEAAE